MANELRQVGGNHYLNMTIQPLEAMQAWMTQEQYVGFLLGSAIKYLARLNSEAPQKGGVTDLRKAHHYIELLLDLTKQDHNESITKS